MPPEPRTPTKSRIAIYVQHLLGTGHFYRASAIARGAADRGHEVLLITGGEPVSGAAPSGMKIAQLPPIRAQAPGDWSLITSDGEPVSDQHWQARREAILGAIAAFRPHVVMVEHFPFGRRAFSQEILAMLDSARHATPDARAVASVRDIVQPPKSGTRAFEIATILEQRFDRVLVHGDPSLVPLDASFPECQRIRPLIHYTGYIDAAASRDTAHPGGTRCGVLVSAGGGRAGMDFLAAISRIRNANPLADEPWTVIAGRGASVATLDNLRAGLRPEDTLLDHADNFRARLRASRLSISQAGYNTAVDLMITGTPALLVPFANGGEREQSIRATAMADSGLPVTMATGGCNLANAIGRASPAAGIPRAIDTDGLRKSVDALEAMLQSEALVDA